MNLNTNITDGWGWYIDLENNTFINVETKELKNESFSVLFNQLIIYRKIIEKKLIKLEFLFFFLLLLFNYFLFL